MYRISEDLESGLGGYHVSTAHDAAPEDIEIVIGASADNLESGTNVQDGDSGAHDRRSSWLCTSLMSWMSRPNDDASVRDHPETEPANATGGFVIELDKVVQVVGGLSTLLKTDLERGIDRRDDEILQRRQAFGSNTYPCKKGKTFWSFVWKACQFPLSLVMIIAVVINSIFLRIKRKAIHDGLYVETCAISATVLDIILRAFTEYKQSRQSEKASEEKRNVPQDVIRGGRRLSVCTNDIVVGDIVPLKNGCQVPADGILFVANSLKIDEQEITGSHLIVQKDILKDPFLLSGSKVIEGIGTMLVTSVGTNTEWGKKIETQPEMDEEKPFQLYVKRLAISASWLVIMLASIACIVQLCRLILVMVGTGHHIHWKGSAKVILNSCQWYMDGANNRIAIGGQRREMEGIIGDMSMRGMRCAALAYQSYELGSLPTTDEELCTLPQDLVLLAIIGIKDPCRPGTRDAVELCKYGDVYFQVCMVTEDEVSTAQAMAIECGILRDTSGEHIRTAAQFCDLTDLEREQISGDILVRIHSSLVSLLYKNWIKLKKLTHYSYVKVLAQASPEDSLLFVKALKRKGYVVAATGMGIHDTKTLHVADVSLAMGIGGTAAAKENSDIIILDDSFATIVKVIQWCRYLYTNIQRYVLFRLTVSVSAVAICVVEVVFYNAFPLNAVQLLLLNLIVDIFGALALAYRPSARKLMGKPPVGIRDHLVTKTMWFKIVIQVIYLVLLLALIHSDSILKLDHGQTADTEKLKNTFIFNSLVFCLVFNEFEIRSGDQTLKEILRDNMFIVTITSTIIFQIILIEFLGIFISAVRLDLKKWLISILVGFLSQVATRFPLEAYQYYRH
ncbi:hypothetical protein DY000_02001449 [Brassica cretica]|uniref:Cation-transporting P-type ATPase N-terminal domain-containing protein n=1 Tax=Brassica cretica TaxID=69181 RepID=A0ABQ7CEH4_BRACR|nr:hypothetical protein DY000_02001449 [Brassica cretica]